MGVGLLVCIGVRCYGERVADLVCMVNCRKCLTDTRDGCVHLRASWAEYTRRSKPWFKKAFRSCKVGCEGVGRNCGVCITECIKKWRSGQEATPTYNVYTHRQSSQNRPLLVPLLSHEYSSCPSPRPPPVLYANPHSPHYYEQQEAATPYQQPYQPPAIRPLTSLVQGPGHPTFSRSPEPPVSSVPPPPPTFSSPAAPLWDSFSHFSQIPPFNLSDEYDASDQV
jgi:hypothetical protein